MSRRQSIAKVKHTPAKWVTCFGCNAQFKGQRGLKIHYGHSRACLLVGSSAAIMDATHSVDIAADTARLSTAAPPLKSTQHLKESAPTGSNFASRNIEEHPNEEEDDTEYGFFSNAFDDEDNINATPDVELPFLNGDDDDDTDNPSASEADNTILDSFEKRRKASKAFDVALFSNEERVLIDLLHTLKKLKTPMKAYGEILKWAVRSAGSGYEFREGPQTSRKYIVSKMQSRLHQDNFTPKTHNLYLPFTKGTVEVIYFDIKEVLKSLLTCPGLNKDENYMFHDDANPNTCDPFAKPDGSFISEINTGRSYLKTYDDLIRDPTTEMLFPCIFAIDKTHCDSGSRLQMEPLTISHGLLKHNIRKQPAAVRILGLINLGPAHKRSDDDPLVSPIPDSYNADDYLPIMNGVTTAAYSLNEYHLQIRCILEKSGFLALQEHGFNWKLQYRGQTIPVLFHPYVPFIIGDTEGHDRLCGHYTSRGKGVHQLCRVCECPTERSGSSKSSNYPLRSPFLINRMVRSKQLDNLGLISQQYLKNAFDDVRFGSHNTRGIFGACPGEILHLVLLGWFKYTIESFFVQAGTKDSDTVKLYHTLCHDIGHQLQRHSERDLPRTMFRKGISSTAHMKGHEYRGCLLVFLVSMYTTRFKQIFSAPRFKKLGKLGNNEFIFDWKMLLSSLLEWHEWLKQPKISRDSARKSGAAVSWLMRLMKQIAPRHTGMKNNTIKMHLVHHIASDILDFGVPQNMNSAFAESAHIETSKVTAHNTQRRPDTFTLQAAHRYVENLAIARGQMEIESSTKQPICNTTLPTKDNIICSRQFVIWKDDRLLIQCRYHPWKKSPAYLKSAQVDSLEEVGMDEAIKALLVTHCMPKVESSELHCFTEYKPEDHFDDANGEDAGQMYRANPCYIGKPWYDHAMITWNGLALPLPGRIHVFLDLHNIKANMCVSFPNSNQDQELTSPGFYAVIESFDRLYEGEGEPKEQAAADLSDFSIFRTYQLTKASNTMIPILYLIPLKSIFQPTACIRDIDDRVSSARINRYIFMVSRQLSWGINWEEEIRMHYSQGVSDSSESENSDSDTEDTDAEALNDTKSDPSSD
jgi:hypothetical protein